jgi:hypothetical protein
MHLHEDQHSNPQQQGISHQAPKPPGLNALRLLPSLCVLQFHYLEKFIKSESQEQRTVQYQGLLDYIRRISILVITV